MKDKKYGYRLSRRFSEKTGVRDPFVEMIKNGLVSEWVGSALFKSVKVGLREKDEMTQKADLVLIHPSGTIGIVECKLSRNNQAKHGMLEQVLLYCELVRYLKDGFIERLRATKKYYLPEDGDPRLFEAARENLGSETPSVVPIVVVDRWGGTLNRTAKFTLTLLNRCFEIESLHRQRIQAFAVGRKIPEKIKP
jgi:hypothetical protein